MKQAISRFASENEKKEYVLSVERTFEQALDDKVAEILSGHLPRILLLAGPTCAGKTTMANKLVFELAERGKHVQVVSFDDFFLDREQLDQNARARGCTIDFDSLAAIDLQELSRCVAEILAGGRITLPIFDFKTGKRSAFRTIEADDQAVFLFEGIQAVYPEVTTLFAGRSFCSIFVSVETPLSVGDSIFSPEDIRFFRRLVRDHRFRGATPAFTFFLWESVRENETKNILPYAPACDYTFNTVIDYEISMLRPHLLPLLSQIGSDDPHKEKAESMLASLALIDDIDECYLPRQSMYHEFLG